MHFIRPKKNLGQHFLKDKNIARKIVSNIRFSGCRNLLEVGPGTGVLTEFLIEIGEFDFTAVEIDPESVRFLTEKYPALLNNIIQEDFLKINLPLLFPDGVIIVGNFPYNISSQIFFKVFENRDFVVEVIGMVQKEVADRICSGPGTKNYGILSVLLQAFYSVIFLFPVPPQVFLPPPKVNSAVVKLVRNEIKNIDCDEKLFIKVVKRAFNQRRKMLRNSLSLFGKEIPSEFAMLRPEQLTVDQFICLTRFFQSPNS